MDTKRQYKNIILHRNIMCFEIVIICLTTTPLKINMSSNSPAYCCKQRTQTPSSYNNNGFNRKLLFPTARFVCCKLLLIFDPNPLLCSGSCLNKTFCCFKVICWKLPIIYPCMMRLVAF